MPLADSSDPMVAATMGWLGAALLGTGVGALAELVRTVAFAQRFGHFPWSPWRKPRVVKTHGELRRYEHVGVWLFAVVIRALAGGLVAGVLAASGPLSPQAAFVTGATAYGTILALAAQTTVRDGSPDAEEATS